MVFAIIVFGIFTIAIIIRDIIEYEDSGYTLLKVVATAIFCGFLMVTCWLAYCSNTEHIIDFENPSNKIEMYGLNDRVGVEGRFVLGSGRINSESYIFYYEKGEYGGYKINKIESDDVEIVEREDEEPIAYLCTYKYSVKENWFWGFGTVSDKNAVKILYVPKGTTQVDFNIDLKE